MRSMRFWLVTTNPLATAANTPAARAKNRAGTPDTKRSAATIPMSTNAVPRSWPMRTMPTVTTTMGTRNGMTTCLSRPRSLRFRVRMVAPTRISPSFTSSEGCTWTPGGRRTQLRFPLTETPNEVNTNAWSTSAPSSAGRARRRYHRTGTWAATVAPTTPITANLAWSRKTLKVEPSSR